jgi:hypothetical protein
MSAMYSNVLCVGTCFAQECVSISSFVSGRGFTACGKSFQEKQEVSGHDLSRAEKAERRMGL